MTKEQEMVKEFHQKFGATINKTPTEISNLDKILRMNLITEEAKEFFNAKTLVEKADALVDLLYVVYGAGITYGIDLEPIFAEVHRSNMTKLWTGEEVQEYQEKEGAENTILFQAVTGYHMDPSCRIFIAKRISDGKAMKSPSYSPANIQQFIV